MHEWYAFPCKFFSLLALCSTLWDCELPATRGYAAEALEFAGLPTPVALVVAEDVPRGKPKYALHPTTEDAMLIAIVRIPIFSGLSRPVLT